MTKIKVGQVWTHKTTNTTCRIVFICEDYINTDIFITEGGYPCHDTNVDVQVKILPFLENFDILPLYNSPLYKAMSESDDSNVLEESDD